MSLVALDVTPVSNKREDAREERRILQERKNFVQERKQTKGGMGGRYAATTQGFKERRVVLAVVGVCLFLSTFARCVLAVDEGIILSVGTSAAELVMGHPRNPTAYYLGLAG